MRRLALIAGLSMLCTAAAADADGYRDCSLKRLAACENSNQLFWATVGKSDKTVRRQEFHRALATFLHGAPPLYIGKTRFGLAQIAANSFAGPGDHHDRLPGGGWFFDGFTPHDAPERCAILFTADGRIQLVALLNGETSAPDAASSDPDVYYLHFYSHDDAPDEASLRLLRKWAGDHRLAATELFTRAKGKWTRRPLP